MSKPAPEELHVLVIDDDPIIRRMIAKTLLKNHYQVATASSAEEGLEQLPYFTFHVAFLDHHLPGMEGLVFGEYLRKNNPHMQIALVTGDDDERLKKLCQEHAIRLIRKPFNLTEILDVVSLYQEEESHRQNQDAQAEGDSYWPQLGTFLQEITEAYQMPGVPTRVEERLVRTIKESLNNIRSSNRYSEEDRVIALAGLLACRVLNVDLPRTQSGQTLYAEFDDAMNQNGNPPAFNIPE